MGLKVYFFTKNNLLYHNFHKVCHPNSNWLYYSETVIRTSNISTKTSVLTVTFLGILDFIDHVYIKNYACLLSSTLHYYSHTLSFCCHTVSACWAPLTPTLVLLILAGTLISSPWMWRTQLWSWRYGECSLYTPHFDVCRDTDQLGMIVIMKTCWASWVYHFVEIFNA